MRVFRGWCRHFSWPIRSIQPIDLRLSGLWFFGRVWLGFYKFGGGYLTCIFLYFSSFLLGYLLHHWQFCGQGGLFFGFLWDQPSWLRGLGLRGFLKDVGLGLYRLLDVFPSFFKVVSHGGRSHWGQPI